MGNLYARVLLHLPYRDLTGGYKVWRREALTDICFADVAAQGYVFQVEMTLRAHNGGCRIVEHPIVFTERTLGLSKMSKQIIGEAAKAVWHLRSECLASSHAAVAEIM